MRRIDDLKKIKEIELEILIEIDTICRKMGFRYMLAAGTLLGAVRHKGFIPWDDDIDIYMPRPDYIKFIDYCKKNQTSFTLFSLDSNREYTQMFAKACDKKTIIIDHEAMIKNCSFGVWVDIFPIDGAGDTKKDAIKFLKSFNFSLSLYTASRWTVYSKSKRRKWYFEPVRFLMFLIGRFVKNINHFALKIDRKIQSRSFDDTNYCACFFGYGTKEIMERNIFVEYIELPFEGHKFYCPKRFDEYLNNLYGDYMKLPPESERISQHVFDVYSTEE